MAGRKSSDGRHGLASAFLPSNNSLEPQNQLTETSSAGYLQRTKWNVRDSDGTAIFTVAAELTSGGKRTADFTKKRGKPCLHLSEGGSY